MCVVPLSRSPRYYLHPLFVPVNRSQPPAHQPNDAFPHDRRPVVTYLYGSLKHVRTCADSVGALAHGALHGRQCQFIRVIRYTIVQDQEFDLVEIDNLDDLSCSRPLKRSSVIAVCAYLGPNQETSAGVDYGGQQVCR